MTNQINNLQRGSRPLGGTVALLHCFCSVFLTPVSICFQSLVFFHLVSPFCFSSFRFSPFLSFTPVFFVLILPLTHPFFLISQSFFSYTDSVLNKPRGQCTIILTCLFATFLITFFFLEHSRLQYTQPCPHPWNKNMWVFSQTYQRSCQSGGQPLMCYSSRPFHHPLSVQKLWPWC